jgi:hypothetical protein
MAAGENTFNAHPGLALSPGVVVVVVVVSIGLFVVSLKRIPLLSIRAKHA